MKKIIMAFVMFTLIGCEAFEQWQVDNNGVPTDTSSTVVDSLREQKEQTEEIGNATGVIGDDLISIDDHANRILDDIALVPDDINYNIDPTLDSIEGSAEAIKESVDDAQKENIRIDEALEDLESANARVSAAVGEIEQLEELVQEYEQSDREVRREALEAMHENITLFFTLGFGMLVAGAFIAFWVNGRLGAVLLAVGVITVGFASASQYYMEEIATAGLYVMVGGFILTMVVIGVMLLNGSNNEKALNEIVELIEETKEHLSPEERKEIFGRDGFASRMQSPMTKKIIAKIKINNGFKNLSRSTRDGKDT
ncbi:MAG: hypothetical protein H8D80_00180 [Proteobacteria bacterium]|nr:hypothetical protein [Pseudomonadota bacterium]